MSSDERLHAELEAAHANGEMGVPGSEVERRLARCRACHAFRSDSCQQMNGGSRCCRQFVLGLVSEYGPCVKWH